MYLFICANRLSKIVGISPSFVFRLVNLVGVSGSCLLCRNVCVGMCGEKKKKNRDENQSHNAGESICNKVNKSNKTGQVQKPLTSLFG